MSHEIRSYRNSDWGKLWPILREVFIRGETYAYPTDMSEEQTREVWVGAGRHCTIALKDSEICGSYILKKNQPGQGSHVCNASYVVSENARGHGLGRTLCLHSLDSAKSLGFQAMQFNLVVSNNSSAIHLWQSCGFSTVGRLHRAFNHPKLGLIDALVMYQWLLKD